MPLAYAPNTARKGRAPSPEESLVRDAQSLVGAFADSETLPTSPSPKIAAFKRLLNAALNPEEQRGLPPLTRSEQNFFGPKTKAWIEAFNRQRKVDKEGPDVDKAFVVALLETAADRLYNGQSGAATSLRHLANSLRPEKPVALPTFEALKIPSLNGTSPSTEDPMKQFLATDPTVRLLRNIHTNNRLAVRHYQGQQMTDQQIVQYLAAVHKVAGELGVSPSAILTVNYAETAFTLHPQVGPPGGTARGLFQPILNTLRAMGKFFEELKDRLMFRGKISPKAVEQMDRAEQTELFKHYIEMQLGSLGFLAEPPPPLTLTGLYSLVFAPQVFKRIHEAPSPEAAEQLVVYQRTRSNSRKTAYGANKHLDGSLGTGGNGQISVAEMMVPLRRHESLFASQDSDSVRDLFAAYNKQNPSTALLSPSKVRSPVD